MRWIIYSVLLGLFTVSPALALDIQPGLWQDTEVTELNGKMQPPSVTTDCIKPEDAKDIVKTAQAQMKDSMKDQAQCSKLDIKQAGNVIQFEMKCGDPKQGAIEASMTMTVNSPQSTSSVMKSTMSLMGQKMVTSTKTESKWIAASCGKK